MKKKLWYFIHDILAHPICGVCWIIGLNTFGDWLHEVSLGEVNYKEEVWLPKEK